MPGPITVAAPRKRNIPETSEHSCSYCGSTVWATWALEDQIRQEQDVEPDACRFVCEECIPTYAAEVANSGAPVAVHLQRDHTRRDQTNIEKN